MNSKTSIAILLATLVAATAQAKNEEPADSLTDELQEVIVTAKQPATKLVGSTLVSTIPGTPLADLGNALDVLAQLPMIKVEENVVSVIGKNNIEIFIDGRPIRDIQELERILSSNLRKVELLMAPGAMYESTTGAVIRISTRRSFIEGLSLTDQTRLQRRRKWSASEMLDISYRTGHWELFLNGSAARNNSLSKGSTVNTLIHDGKETVVGGTQHNTYPATTGTLRTGLSYSEGPQSFGLSYRYNPERGDFRNSGSEWLDDNPPVRRWIDNMTRAHSHLASLYYENTFAEKIRLHFDGDFRHSVSDEDVATTYPDSDNPDVNSSARRKSTLWAAKLYLNFPLWQGDFTVGTQDSHTRTSLDYRMQSQSVGQYIPSSLTDARQTSAALFASWSRVFGKFSLSAGARYEYVDYDFSVDGKHDNEVSRRDNLLTPDLSLSYSFNESSQISLSYKMATVRPPYSRLTGSLNYVGLHEIEGGNPALRDERMHDLQFFGMLNGFMLQADFMRSLDSYAFVKQIHPATDLQILMHPVNIDVSAMSLYLVWSRPVGRWTPDVTLGAYRQWLRIGRQDYNKPIISYYFNNTLALPHGWTLTANISGNSGGDMHTNRFSTAWFTMDASVGKSLLDKALTLRLSATDIFNTADNSWTMNTYGIFVDKHQSHDNRGISLSITYNFQPRKTTYKGSSAAESELKRL